jgi:rfaE bifunctional protein kinase chain/domain
MKLSDLSVLVVGDSMLDIYRIGHSSRLSPEAPVPVVLSTERTYRLGGAANVAFNICNLGVKSFLYTLIGSDDSGKTLTSILDSTSILNYSQPLLSITTTKTRIISRSQQLVRIDEEEYVAKNTALSFSHSDTLHSLINKSDIVLLSDYHKGSLQFVDRIITLCSELNTTVVVDPKNPDLSCYTNCFLMAPNLAEFESYAGPCANDAALLHAAVKVKERLSLKHLIVTLSERGLLLVSDNSHEFIPAFAKEVVDVTGAGDTFLAFLTCFITYGINIRDSAIIANVAASIAVSKLGTAAITLSELLDSIRLLDQHDLLKYF